MSVEGAGHPPESPSGPSLPPVAPAAPYRRLGGLAPWISWLLLILAAAYAISTVMTVAVYGFGEYSTPARIDRFSGGEIAISVLGFVQSGIALAVAVLFIIWFYRAYDNLRAVTSAGPRRSPGWTIGAWFVPILDLILPKLMLDEVWRGSEPDTDRNPETVRVPAFHHLWWWSWVVAFLLGLVVGVVSAVSGFQSGLSGDPAPTTVNGPIVIVGSALSAVAAALGAAVVRRTTERQDERARRLGLLASPGWVPATPQPGGVG